MLLKFFTPAIPTTTGPRTRHTGSNSSYSWKAPAWTDKTPHWYSSETGIAVKRALRIAPCRSYIRRSPARRVSLGFLFCERRRGWKATPANMVLATRGSMYRAPRRTDDGSRKTDHHGCAG
jgi:hypothetical protein